MANVVGMHGTGLPPREPDAACEACGARGTVGRAVRYGERREPLEVHRFCAACWPEERARYDARWGEQDRLAAEAWMRAPDATSAPPSMGSAFESATWHTTLDLVTELWGELRRHERGDGPPEAEGLARLAAEIVARAAEMEGPMPLAVEAFVERFGPRAG
jgi:hypothetical protein